MSASTVPKMTSLFCRTFFILFLQTISSSTGKNNIYEAAITDTREYILDRALQAISRTNITASIPNFYPYEYDGHPYDIHDGGHGMYDGLGNKIYRTDGDFSELLYDYDINYANYVYGVRSNHPLFGLMWIKNTKREYHSYRIQVEGYPGHWVGASIDSSAGTVNLTTAFLHYKAYQVNVTGTPSICEVYFFMENDFWMSATPDEFNVLSFSKNASHLKNSVIVTGRAKNIMMGYMLLSSFTGNSIPYQEIENALVILGNSLINLDSTMRNFTEEALLSVEAVTDSLRSSVTNWYNYTYSMQEIQNGGEDMYGRKGNRIYVAEDFEQPTHLYYGLKYRYSNYEVTSRASHPFMGLMWIINEMKEIHRYTWKVTSFTGRNENGVINTFNGTFVTGEITMQYEVFMISSIRDHPSICEVYFTAGKKSWNSSDLHEFTIASGNDTENLENVVTVNKRPHNLLLGYMLLSKKNATALTEDEVVGSLTIAAEELGKIEKPPKEFLQEAMESLEGVGDKISQGISDWHNYLYDEGLYALSYEPREMYTPWGNSLIFAEDLDHASYDRSNYDLYYSNENMATKCKMDHPFVSLMWIESNIFDSFSLKVHSHVDLIGNETYRDYSGSLTVMGTEVTYFVFQLYDRPQPSICEVYFTLSNPTNWSSEKIDSYTGKLFDRSSVQDNYIYLLGYIKKVFIGYMLLSKYPGVEIITEDEIRTSLSLLTQAVSESFTNDEEALYCREEVVAYPYESSMTITFPETAAGTVADSSETCSGESTDYLKVPYGTRKCSNDGEWGDTVWATSCYSEIMMTTEKTTTTTTTSTLHQEIPGSTTTGGGARIGPITTLILFFVSCINILIMGL